MFQPKGRESWRLRVTLKDGRSAICALGTRSPELAKAEAGLIEFLRLANPGLLVPVVERRMSVGDLYDTFAALSQSRPARQAIEAIGEGATPPEVRVSIDAAQGRKLRGYVYAIRNSTSGAVKIGFASNPRGRFSSLSVAHSERLELLGVMPGDVSLEKEIASAFGESRIRGEWFRPHRDLIAWTKQYLTEPR